MSLQSLIEMDNLGGSSAERNIVVRPQPKPRQRSKMANLFSTDSPQSKERDVDDVMSLSSGEGSVIAATGKGFQHSASPPEHKAAARRKFSRAPTAFENAAYVEDNGEEGDNVFSKRTKHVPSASQRSKGVVKSDYDSSGGKQRKRDVSLDRTFSISSKGEEDTDISVGPMSEGGRRKGENESDSTYTIENERYKESRRLTKKPPKAAPKLSKIPKALQRKSVRMESVSGDKETSVKSINEKEAAFEKKRQEHHVVEIEPEVSTVDANENDGNDNAGTDNTGKSAALDETDAASVSSSATVTKDSVKSRFGKLFNTSALATSKSKKPPTEIDREAGARNTKSLVSRWKQTAHTFLKTSSSKPFGEDTIDESKDNESDNDKSIDLKKSSSTGDDKRKSKETTISMPDSDLEGEGEDGSIVSQDDSVTSRSRRGHKNEQELEANAEEKPEPEKLTAVNKMSKFKPLSKLLKSRSKEKIEKQPKQKEIENPSQKVSKVKATPPDNEDVSDDGKELLVVHTRKQKSEKKISDHHRQPLSHNDTHEDSPTAIKSSDDDKSESESEQENVKEIKPPQLRKIQKKPEKLQLVDSTSGAELLFGVTVHSSDLLPLDPNIIHPVVKVSVMSQNGLYMKRSENPDNNSTSKSGKKRSKRHGKHRHDHVNDFTDNASDSILPIMSQPCQVHHSFPLFAPTWNELFIFEEPFRRFAERSDVSDPEKDPVLFFELMDFLPMNNNGSSMSVSGFHGNLFKPVKLRPKNKLPGPEVFSWWKAGKREKLNCTLYVTPKGIVPPETKTNTLRQLLSMRKEHLTQAILDSQMETRQKKQRSHKKSLYELREQANWARLDGQSCKPPNKLLTALPSSQIQSLNIVVSGNVHCTKFSPCGTKLATGLDSEELHVVLLFDVPSWTLLKCLKGHHGIIYEIAWKLFELDDETSYHYIASASADSTVRIWKMKNNDEKSISLVKILHHPSYVYCVKFHPTHPSLLATGCYDFIIRIWDIQPKHAEISPTEKRKKYKNKKETENSSLVSPIILLDQHSGFVNCLMFDLTGQYLFSGDGVSCLFKWNCTTPSLKKSWKLEKDVKLVHSSLIPIPINSIDIHPTGNRLLVQLRDSCIKVLDAVTFIPLQSFPGLKNERFQIRSCFSPCGNLVLSGSEDSTLCVWDSDTGKILRLLTPENRPNCVVTCVDYHPQDYYVVVGLTSANTEPSPILIYFHHQSHTMNYPLLKKTAMKMRESLERSRSQSTEFATANQPAVKDRNGGVPKRADSSEKFISIIQKLDTALYFAQQRNKMRQSETEFSACISNEQHDNQSQNLNKVVGANNNALPQREREIKGSSSRQENNDQEIFSQQQQHSRKSNRPRSASSIAKEKRRKFQNTLQQRTIKSDSEPSYKLKMQGSSSSSDNDNEDEGDYRKGKRSKTLSLKPALSSFDITEEKQVVNEAAESTDAVRIVRPKPLKRSVLSQEHI